MSLTGADIAAGFKKKPLLFICGALCVVMLALTYFRMGAVDDLQGILDQNTREAGVLKINITNSTLLDEQIAALKGFDEKVDSKLINPANLALNLQYFYRIENETSTKLLELRQNRPDGTGKSKAYVSVPYVVSVQGNFSQLIDFMRHLESAPFFCRMNSASMNVRAADGRADLLSLSLTLQLLGKP